MSAVVSFLGKDGSVQKVEKKNSCIHGIDKSEGGYQAAPSSAYSAWFSWTERSCSNSQTRSLHSCQTIIYLHTHTCAHTRSPPSETMAGIRREAKLNVRPFISIRKHLELDCREMVYLIHVISCNIISSIQLCLYYSCTCFLHKSWEQQWVLLIFRKLVHSFDEGKMALAPGCHRHWKRLSPSCSIPISQWHPELEVLENQGKN